MAVAAVATLRGLLRKAKQPTPAAGGGGGGKGPAADELDPVPAVGFRARQQHGKLAVSVLGARHLPARLPAIGSLATGYFVKVKLFPGAAKYETEQKAESWPTFNETFSFPLGQAAPTGRFLMLTVYAVDELNRRKAVGALTWPVESQPSQPAKSAPAAHPEIWRRLHDVRGAVLPATAGHQSQYKKEARRNQVEMSLRAALGGPGEPDTLTLTAHRVRWSLQSTRELEEKKAQLYVKLSVLEGAGGAPLRARKTRTFAPNIAVHLSAEEDEATLQTPLPPAGPRRDALVCQVSLCTRPNRIAKKVVLGRAVFGATELADGGGSEQTVPGHVAKALQAPGRTVTQWHSLL